MDNVVVQVLTALGGLAGVAAVINAFISRRKVGADAASVLTQAASGLVQDLQAQIDELKAWRSAQRVWSRTVIAELHKAGIDVPPTPDD